MADVPNVGGGELVFRLKIKTEVNPGDNLENVTDQKIKEYFRQNVDKNPDGVVDQSEMLDYRNRQVKEAEDPTEWKSEVIGTPEGTALVKKTRGAVTQYYDESDRLVRVVTDKGGGVIDEVRYEYNGESNDLISKMVYINGKPLIAENPLPESEAGQQSFQAVVPETVSEQEQVAQRQPADENVPAPDQTPVDTAEAEGQVRQPSDEVTTEGAGDPVTEPPVTEQVSERGAAEETVPAKKKEEKPETGDTVAEQLDNGRVKVTKRNEDGTTTVTMKDGEDGEAVEVQYDSEGNLISHAKSGESFKKTAARLGFKSGTPEYEAFVKANQSAAKKGWFLVGADVTIPKALESKVDLKGLNVDSNEEVQKYNTTIVDQADVSKYKNKTESKTLDKNTTWWALAKESLKAEGKAAPSIREIQNRTGELMKLNEGKNPTKGAEVVFPKFEASGGGDSE